MSFSDRIFFDEYFQGCEPVSECSSYGHTAGPGSRGIMSVAFLGLGSNLGDRLAQLAGALRALRAHPAVSIVHGSSVYESKPVGVTNQPDFLNLVVKIETTLSPPDLLAVCLRTEASLGRERRERWGPRTIDIDVLSYDSLSLSNADLTLPHPRMHERGFVLVPLGEIAPDFRIGDLKVGDLAKRVGVEGLRPVLSWNDFPLWQEVSVEELPDPVSPELIAAALRDRRGFFYLDSARSEGNARPAFSFIGFEPFLTWEANDGVVTFGKGSTTEKFEGDPLGHLRTLLSRYRSASAPHGIPFAGGAVGYFGYEFGARLELDGLFDGRAAACLHAGIAGRHGGKRQPYEERSESLPADKAGLPEAYFGFYDGVIACDLSSGKTYLVANPIANRSTFEILSGLREAISHAQKERKNSIEFLHPENSSLQEPQSNLTRDEYLQRIVRIKDYIAAGDVYQVNFSQRFATETTVDPYLIYQRLRTLSPAPFGAYLDVGGHKILSSSPELFLRADRNGKVLTRPIKGTRPRGKTLIDDQRLAAELLSSEKDHAELLMIVDLERNDLGRVCRYGSIQVEERYRTETHPTVFHLVATISGELAAGKDLFDCLRSMLPGGSITGAPKIRAMEIIDELESCRRDVYTGSLGYLGFDGTCDLNIAIRTIIQKEGRASYHVGGGIVADSDPEAEYQETLTKGRAMRAALMGTTLT